MAHYSAMKKNKIMSFAGKWMELEIIMLSEINQSSKGQILFVFTHMQNVGLK
jgi:hypothetical protein